ncbi:hypothetical protein PTKIN_Ptkin11bG0176700 [Pterospermum kingtungense]
MMVKKDTKFQQHQVYVSVECKSVKLEAATKMKSLFPVTAALPKLETITAEGVSELKQLFDGEDEEVGVLEEKQIQLPKLWMLDLLQLLTLITYCPKG